MDEIDLINKIEQAQQRQAEEMAKQAEQMTKLTSSIAELVTTLKLTQQEAVHMKEFHAEAKEHIKFAKPVLLRSEMWHKRIDAWITKYLPAIAILAVVGATYKGFLS